MADPLKVTAGVILMGAALPLLCHLERRSHQRGHWCKATRDILRWYLLWMSVQLAFDLGYTDPVLAWAKFLVAGDSAVIKASPCDSIW